MNENVVTGVLLVVLGVVSAVYLAIAFRNRKSKPTAYCSWPDAEMDKRCEPLVRLVRRELKRAGFAVLKHPDSVNLRVELLPRLYYQLGREELFGKARYRINHGGWQEMPLPEGIVAGNGTDFSRLAWEFVEGLVRRYKTGQQGQPINQRA